MADRLRNWRIFAMCRSPSGRMCNPRALRSDYGGKIFYSCAAAQAV